MKGSPIVRMSKSGLVLAPMVTLKVLVNIRLGQNVPFSSITNLLFPKLVSEVPSRGFQMVRMARLGLAMAPMLSLKVLANFRLISLVTSYEGIFTNFNKK